MNEIQLFNNEELNIKVRAIKNDDGSISVSAEDTAIGYGWTQVKGDKVYLKFERMNTYIWELTGENSPQVGKDDFIPESLFYMLGMKAKNDVAKKFQKWLAIEVIPSIRQTGSFNSSPTKEEPKLLGEDLLAKLDKKTDELGVYYKPTHIKKININKIIKTTLGTLASKKNCERVKEMLLLSLGKEIYDEVPISVLHSTDTYEKIFSFCKLISNEGGEIQTDLFGGE